MESLPYVKAAPGHPEAHREEAGRLLAWFIKEPLRQGNWKLRIP